MTKEELISDILSREEFKDFDPLKLSLIVREIAEQLNWLMLEKREILRDCSCQRTLYECADELRRRAKLTEAKKETVEA